jgi:outer membrane protein assembly factor BamA
LPADQPGGGQDASAPGLAPFAGRRVVAIEITGHNVTKDRVITREIRTKVGDPLDLEAVERDVARLDNLSIFAEIRVEGAPVGDDGVRLVFIFKEMPSWFPILSYVYTEENGFSWGAGISAGNLTGRDLSVSARVYFGDLEQQWSRVSWPWIRGNHVSFDFYGARYTRPDTLRGFEETSYEFTPEVGT